MQENYEITIVGRQTVDRETDEIKVDTLGDYVEKGAIKFISYMCHFISKIKCCNRIRNIYIIT